MDRMLALAVKSLCALCLLSAGVCGGRVTTPTPTPTPIPTPTPVSRGINDPVFDATIGSTCSDHRRDTFVFLGPIQWLDGTEVSDRLVQDVSPDCYAHYQYKYEGLHTAGGRPLPWMGRTCGAFRLLAVFVDNETNRGLLQKNTKIPQGIKDLVSAGQVQDALQRLLNGYTSTELLGELNPDPLPISFGFDVVLSSGSLESFSRVTSGSTEWTGFGIRDTRFLEAVDVGTRFPNYDAVVLLDHMSQAGLGIKRWPKQHPTSSTTPATATSITTASSTASIPALPPQLTTWTVTWCPTASTRTSAPTTRPTSGLHKSDA